MKNRAIFIAGIDTSIGKTIIAARLARAFRRAGLKVGVFKPVETGAIEKDDGSLIGRDGELLRRAAGLDRELTGRISPYLFRAPISPHRAALEEGRAIDLALIRESFESIRADSQITIVEGAGGVMTPLDQERFIGSLPKALDIPTLLVCHPFLGSISQTLMSIDALGSLGADLIGFMVNQFKDDDERPPLEIDLIRRMAAPGGEIGYFGFNRWEERLARGDFVESDLDLIEDRIDIEPILAALDKRERERADYERRDKKYLWHPFTQMADWESSSIVTIDSGDGVTLRDTAGREYLDLFSSYWCSLHGHGQRAIGTALMAQYGKIAHSTFLGLSNRPAIDLAEKLVELTPANLTRVFYSDNGSSAVEVALKMALQYQRQIGARSKEKFVALELAYHGDTVGAMSVSGVDVYKRIFAALMTEPIAIPSPYCYRCPFGKEPRECAFECAQAAETIIEANKDQIAALIIEPLVQAPGGMIVAPDGYLSRIAAIAKERSILLIADEVAVGFGRTGHLFASQAESVEPDIMALSKSLTSGTLPFAATMASEEIFEVFKGRYEDLKTFFHGHTYTGNQLGATVALANLKLIEKLDVAKMAREKGAFFGRKLERLRALNSVGDIRRRGLIGGIELVRSKREKAPFDFRDNIGAKITEAARARSLLIRPIGSVIPFFPAPVATEAELEKMADILHESIKETLG